MDKLPHGLNGKLKSPVPDQDALQFKVDEVIEKKTMLKEEEIFESVADHEKRIKKNKEDERKKGQKSRQDVASGKVKARSGKKAKPKIDYRKKTK